MLKKILPTVRFASTVVAAAVAFPFRKPSNVRDWSPDQAVLPFAEFNGNLVNIHNIRNCSYRSTDDYTVRHYDRTYDLRTLETVYYMVEPFGTWNAAHTLVSFGFANGDHVAISVEIRKKKGDSYSPLLGLLRAYELMYVIADERDVIRLRSNFRKHNVYLYPVRVDTSLARALLVTMLERANELKVKPDFYNTITSACLGAIVRHVNSLSPSRIPWDKRILAPEHSDRLAYELGLLDTTLPFEELKKHCRINERALRAADSPDFSKKIREY